MSTTQVLRRSCSRAVTRWGATTGLGASVPTRDGSSVANCCLAPGPPWCSRDAPLEVLTSSELLACSAGAAAKPRLQVALPELESPIRHTPDFAAGAVRIGAVHHQHAPNSATAAAAAAAAAAVASTVCSAHASIAAAAQSDQVGHPSELANRDVCADHPPLSPTRSPSWRPGGSHQAAAQPPCLRTPRTASGSSTKCSALPGAAHAGPASDRPTASALWPCPQPLSATAQLVAPRRGCWSACAADGAGTAHTGTEEVLLACRYSELSTPRSSPSGRSQHASSSGASPLRGTASLQLAVPQGEAPSSPPQLSPQQMGSAATAQLPERAAARPGDSALSRFRAVANTHTSVAAFRRAGERASEHSSATAATSPLDGPPRRRSLVPEAEADCEATQADRATEEKGAQLRQWVAWVLSDARGRSNVPSSALICCRAPSAAAASAPCELLCTACVGRLVVSSRQRRGGCACEQMDQLCMLHKPQLQVQDRQAQLLKDKQAHWADSGCSARRGAKRGQQHLQKGVHELRSCHPDRTQPGP